VANATQRNTEAIERLAGQIEQEIQEDQREQENRRTRNTVLLIFVILLGMAFGGVKMFKIWMEASRDRRM
jgi:cytochrome c oxidase assembly protein Cox11